MTQRVDSLRKKKEILEENFMKKGIDSLFADLKVTVKIADTGIKKHKKLISAVKRKVDKLPLSQDADELIAYVDNSQGNYQSLKVEVLNKEEGEFGDYITDLLKSMTEIRVSSTDIFLPVRVTVTTGEGTERVGYSVLARSLKKKYHGEKWYRKTSNFPVQLIFDMNTLIAETIVMNTLEKFARGNEELVRYLMAKSLIELSVYQRLLGVQSDSAMSEGIEILLEQIRTKSDETEQNPKISMYKDAYDLKKNQNGHIECIQESRLLSILAPEFIKQMKNTQYRTLQEVEGQQSYAKTFQTKSYIYKKTQEKMEDNVLLQRYNFVELDNEVDLTLFSQIEEEFLKFIKMIEVPKAMDHSFRIKKLGHYKANGAYFPNFKATVIDVDHPDAYVHELGHQLDYTMGPQGDLLSEGVDFRPILDSYINLVEKQILGLPTNDPYRERWEGKTKYNSEYYLQPTEVFARSFELYVESKGIESSFLKETYDAPVYTKDVAYIKKINEYFDNLMKTINTKENNMKQAV